MGAAFLLGQNGGGLAGCFEIEAPELGTAMTIPKEAFAGVPDGRYLFLFRYYMEKVQVQTVFIPVDIKNASVSGISEAKSMKTNQSGVSTLSATTSGGDIKLDKLWSTDDYDQKEGFAICTVNTG